MLTSVEYWYCGIDYCNSSMAEQKGELNSASEPRGCMWWALHYTIHFILPSWSKHNLLLVTSKASNSPVFLFSWTRRALPESFVWKFLGNRIYKPSHKLVAVSVEPRSIDTGQHLLPVRNRQQNNAMWNHSSLMNNFSLCTFRIWTAEKLSLHVPDFIFTLMKIFSSTEKLLEGKC